MMILQVSMHFACMKSVFLGLRDQNIHPYSHISLHEIRTKTTQSILMRVRQQPNREYQQSHCLSFVIARSKDRMAI